MTKTDVLKSVPHMQYCFLFCQLDLLLLFFIVLVIFTVSLALAKSICYITNLMIIQILARQVVENNF